MAPRPSKKAAKHSRLTRVQRQILREVTSRAASMEHRMSELALEFPAAAKEMEKSRRKLRRNLADIVIRLLNVPKKKRRPR